MLTAPAQPVRRLAWATDVHLNFLSASGLDAFREALARQEADAVVITGDIAEAPSVEPLLSVLAAELKTPIYFVLGNHDYYRSSIPRVREVVREMSRRSSWLSWLPAAGVVELTRDVALVGTDGWADGRYGDFMRSPVMLNDYLLIAELSGLSKETRLDKLHALGDAEAATLRGPLDEALRKYRRVIVATHVPPFKESCWHEGRISNDDWLPHFSCKATGDVLREAAKAHPDKKIRVLCGHTHGAGQAEILPNLKVMTGAAEYGEPRVQGVLELTEA
ncbi:MAG: metallophosphoesterase [Minicystis sp.]